MNCIVIYKNKGGIMKETPTNELYGSMQVAYDHFNQTLFSGKLPPVLFTTQRKKNVMGYFHLSAGLQMMVTVVMK